MVGPPYAHVYASPACLSLCFQELLFNFKEVLQDCRCFHIVGSVKERIKLKCALHVMFHMLPSDQLVNALVSYTPLAFTIIELMHFHANNNF